MDKMFSCVVLFVGQASDSGACKSNQSGILIFVDTIHHGRRGANGCDSAYGIMARDAASGADGATGRSEWCMKVHITEIRTGLCGSLSSSTRPGAPSGCNVQMGSADAGHMHGRESEARKWGWTKGCRTCGRGKTQYVVMG